MIERTRERLGGDERAVSPVVGFVLMFALIMIVFTLYQTNVVPAQNTEVEFDHSQTVEGQMSVLNDQFIQTAVTGERRSATVSTGLQYPSRALAINPGNPVGTLRTVDTGDVTISGIDTGHSSPASCTYTDLSVLQYQPHYNRLDEETTYSIEYGMLVEGYSTSTNTNLQSEGVAFPNDADEPIRLILIEGDMQASRMTTSVSTEFVHNYTTIRSQDGGTISLPTTLSEDGWNALLDDKANLDLSGYTTSSGFNTATIAVDPGSVGRTIQVKKVTPGVANDRDPGCARDRYIVNESVLSPNVSLPTEERMAVSVEDQFGNPITENVTVQASANGDGSLTPTSRNLNASGQAGFTYDPVEADSGETVDVKVNLTNGSASGPRIFELDYPELTIDNETRLSPNVSINKNAVLTVSTGDSTGRTLSGIDIDASHTGDGTLAPTSTNSDDGGEATFVYTPSDTDSGNTVQVRMTLPNGSDSVTFDLEYPTTSAGNRKPLNVNKLATGIQTQLKFKTTPGSPIIVEGFSIVTKDDLANFTETNYTHAFEIPKGKRVKGRPDSVNSPRYESSEPIQFDGQDYYFDGDVARVTSSDVFLYSWPRKPSFRVHIDRFASSYEEADMIVYLITENGKRPVYLDAHIEN